MQTDISSYGKIYRLTDKTNGKMYHGQTTKADINDRWYAYKTLNCKSQIKLYNALKAHGPEKFLFEVIDTTPQNQPQLDNLEIFYIAKFNSMHNGYNCDPGGKGGKHSEETKQKMSKSLSGKNNPMFGRCGNKSPRYGKLHTEEIKTRLSEINKGENNPRFGKKVSCLIKTKLSKVKSGTNNPMFGRQHSEETKRKMSNSLKGKNVGITRSEETKQKMSEAAKLRWQLQSS